MPVPRKKLQKSAAEAERRAKEKEEIVDVIGEEEKDISEKEKIIELSSEVESLKAQIAELEAAKAKAEAEAKAVAESPLSRKRNADDVTLNQYTSTSRPDSTSTSANDRQDKRRKRKPHFNTNLTEYKGNNPIIKKFLEFTSQNKSAPQYFIKKAPQFDTEEKRLQLKTVDVLVNEENCSTVHAMGLVAESGGGSITSLKRWRNELDKEKDDGRKVNSDFEIAVVNKLWSNALHRLSNADLVDPNNSTMEAKLWRIYNTMYQYTHITSSAGETQRSAEYSDNKKILDLKFSSHWIANFVKRRLFARNKSPESKGKESLKPAESETLEVMEKIQEFLRKDLMPAGLVVNPSTAGSKFSGTTSAIAKDSSSTVIKEVAKEQVENTTSVEAKITATDFSDV